MQDLISRQAAIDAIGEIHPLDYNAQAIAEKIKGLPSAHCDNCPYPDEYVKAKEDALRWIPVSERRPEDWQDCLVTYSNGRVEIATFAEDLYEVDEYGFHDKRGVAGWFYFDDEYGYQEYSEVIAWMPLPDPYKEEER